MGARKVFSKVKGSINVLNVLTDVHFVRQIQIFVLTAVTINISKTIFAIYVQAIALNVQILAHALCAVWVLS